MQIKFKLYKNNLRQNIRKLNAYDQKLQMPERIFWREKGSNLDSVGLASLNETINSRVILPTTVPTADDQPRRKVTSAAVPTKHSSAVHKSYRVSACSR